MRADLSAGRQVAGCVAGRFPSEAAKRPMLESEMAISHVFWYSHNKRYRKEPVHSMTIVISVTSGKAESLFGVPGVTRVAAQQGNVDLARGSKSLGKPNIPLHSVMIEPIFIDTALRNLSLSLLAYFSLRRPVLVCPCLWIWASQAALQGQQHHKKLSFGSTQEPADGLEESLKLHR